MITSEGGKQVVKILRWEIFYFFIFCTFWILSQENICIVKQKFFNPKKKKVSSLRILKLFQFFFNQRLWRRVQSFWPQHATYFCILFWLHRMKTLIHKDMKFAWPFQNILHLNWSRSLKKGSRKQFIQSWLVNTV